jgi:hypothetical protein
MGPVADARALVSERFPTALAAFLGGGVLSDRRTPTSDLDIVVIVGGLSSPYRESMTWRNWPAELFVHRPDTIGAWFRQGPRQAATDPGADVYRRRGPRRF